ncbi:MAG: pitrilysin family protein [Clostridium perfringens]|nr:pitrilysin family protein [Clostridium perfringens]
MNKLSLDKNITKLPNGIKVVTIKKDTMLVAINVAIEIGSLYEKDTERGMCHFIEHMMFKGTKTRNNEVLNEELESLGGEYNAYTDYTSTVYSINCINEEIQNAVMLLSDMMINSTFPESEIEREKGVVIAEIKSSRDDVEEFSLNRVNEIGFSKSPLRYDVAGTEKTVEKFTRDDIINFYNNYYTPDNCTIVIVSSLNHSEMLNMILENFKAWEGQCHKKIEIIKEKNKEVVETTHKKHIEQSTIAYLYSLVDIKKEDELPLKILSHKLGDSDNSILFRELREKRGLAYDVYSYLDIGHDVNIMNIFAAVSREDLKESKNIIDEAILNIKNEIIDFDNKSLEIIKKIHRTAVISMLEDYSDLCSYALNQVLEGEDLKDLEKSIEELDKITKEDIYRVCRTYLNNPTVHILKSER